MSTKILPRLAPLVLALGAATGCLSDAPSYLGPTQAGKGPVVRFDAFHKPFAEIPLPNDFATRYDPTSPTGRRLNASVLAGPTSWERATRAELDKRLDPANRFVFLRRQADDETARKIKERLVAIAAHNLGVPAERVVYKDGNVVDTASPDKKLTWMELVTIAHRHVHKLPQGMEPGLSVSHIMPVPTGGGLPTADGRVQMYPCYAFEFHLVLMTVDPDLGKPAIKRYVIGHDCGVVINPKIVRGMTMGGIAHGIGAALYEEFAYSEDGLLMAQSFMDYVLPSSHEVPEVEIVHHETPSPHTVFGQKGSGEAGYLGGPAAVANAINDALAPLDARIDTLPMSHDVLWRTISKTN